MTFSFILSSILLGIGLAMDAFSVSVANGLSNPSMKQSEKMKIAGVFAFFQFIMPVIGWAFVTFLAEKFAVISKFIPFIAFGLLLFIGVKMIVEEVAEMIKKKKGASDESEVSASGDHNELSKEKKVVEATFGTLIVQGIATSLDALSAGFTIVEYPFVLALVCGLIIAIVTFALCLIGVTLGKKVGEKISGFATIIGGCILIAIGVKILLGL